MQFINTNMQNKLFSIIGILVLAVLISGCVQSQKSVEKEIPFVTIEKGEYLSNSVE